MQRRQFLGATLSTTAALTLQSPRLDALTEAQLPAEITQMSASMLSAAIHQRLVGCTEVMAAYLARIHHYNPVYNAIVSMRPDEESLALARAADLVLLYFEASVLN